MLILKRSLVLILPLLMLSAFGFLFYYPSTIYWLPLLLVLLLAAAIWELNGRNWQKNYWHFLISPVFFLISLFVFILFIDQMLFKWSVVFLAAVLISLVLDNLFTYFYQPGRYQPYSLENTSGYLNLISAFLFFSGLYSAIVFLGLSAFWLIPLALLAALILSYQAIWVHQISWSQGWPYVLINTLIVTESFWVISFLPTSFYVNGALLAIVYYFIMGLSCSWLLTKLEKRTVKRYIIVAIIAMVIILGTARWM